MKEQFHQTKNGRIWYRISDPIHTSKPFLVFLPGLTADHRLFDTQIEYFEPNYNVLVWDAPAHNLSRPFDFNFDLTDKATWLWEILNRESFSKPILIGQSMGGYVSQVFMEKYPDRVAGFISIDSAPLQRKYITRAEIWLLKHTEPIYKLYPWKSLLKYGSRGVAATAWGRQLMLDMMMVYNDCPEYYVKLTAHGYAMLAKAAEADLVYRITCPALLLCGDRDRAGSTARYNRAWHSRSGIPLEWIENAGHNSNSDAPEQVNKLIESFISTLPYRQ